MKTSFIPFDDMQSRVSETIADPAMLTMPDAIDRLYLVRDLFGKIRISVSDTLEENEQVRIALKRLAHALGDALGVRGYPPEEGVLFVDNSLLDTLGDTAQEIHPRVFMADRLVTGHSWWKVADMDEASVRTRITLYSVKGGLGCSTTAAVLAWHLARKGERVLVVDMDLESPGISSAMVEKERRPKFGLVDWFVEDLVGQGEKVIEDMLVAPAWAQSLAGDVRVAPTHGRDPGDYLGKLGRVYMETAEEPWAARLERALVGLETTVRPAVVLLESRNGLHDIAAATVTDLKAEILLFATHSESTWTDYGILFSHWRIRNLARDIRERISVVSALTPAQYRKKYMDEFKTQAWDLFRDNLYDDIAAGNNAMNDFSFDRNEENAPHNPMEISWTLDFSAGSSLQDLNEETINPAYEKFLKAFDDRVHIPSATTEAVRD